MVLAAASSAVINPNAAAATKPPEDAGANNRPKHLSAKTDTIQQITSQKRETQRKDAEEALRDHDDDVQDRGLEVHEGLKRIEGGLVRRGPLLVGPGCAGPHARQRAGDALPEPLSPSDFRGISAALAAR